MHYEQTDVKCCFKMLYSIPTVIIREINFLAEVVVVFLTTQMETFFNVLLHSPHSIIFPQYYEYIK